jgi:Flp pilus assembly protein TadB
VLEEVNKAAPADRSVSELVTDMTDQVRRLVRDELRLATSELQRKGKRFGTGAGLFGAAGVIAWFGVAAFVAAAILALSLVVAGWLAAVIVGVALVVVAAIAALIGKGQLKRATPPVPEEAISGVRDDVATVKDGVHTA